MVIFKIQGRENDPPLNFRSSFVRNQTTVKRVRENIEEYPSTSPGKWFEQDKVYWTSFRHTLKNLNLFSCKIKFVHYLNPRDHAYRSQYAVRFQELGREDPESLQMIIPDETHFLLNGFMNKQNCKIWGSANLKEIHQN